jgi:hypothetical protein
MKKQGRKIQFIYKIWGKKRSVPEIAEMTNIAKSTVRHRLAICKTEGFPFEKVNDNQFWASRNKSVPKKKYKINGKEYTLRELSVLLDKDVSTVDYRIKRCRVKGWPIEKVFDEDYWHRRTAQGRQVKKQKQKQKERSYLSKIPEPSPVELRMEQKGYLHSGKVKEKELSAYRV